MDPFWIEEALPYTTPSFDKSTDYVKGGFSSNHTPIVIDHGAWQCRAGWGGEHDPRMQFDSLVAKVRDKSTGELYVALGNDLQHVSTSDRTSARSPFDANTSVVVHPEMMEHVLDYIFSTLGIRDQPIHHPIVMTEVACNPSASRQLLNELLFECYNVPKVVYGVDAMFSYHQNDCRRDGGDGLIVSSGHTGTYILPVFDARMCGKHAKRLNLGGLHTTEFMLKLMQLKYPNFPTKMTSVHAQTLVTNHAYISEDYVEELRSMADFNVLAERDRIIQFPYIPIEQKSEEELAAIEKKKEQQRNRFKEQAAKQRQEKLKVKETQLADYNVLKAMKADGKMEYKKQLALHGFKTEADLDTVITALEVSITKARNRMLGLPLPEEVPKEPPTFPLVDVPDNQLNDEQKKEKRKQRLLKAGHDAREKVRKEREEARQRQLEAEQEEDARRQADPDKWITETRQQRLQLLKRMMEKQKRQTALADRRSHASQSRMKAIAALAADDAVTPGGKNRRKRKTEDDTFGMEDEDWMIYREISKEEDSDDDEHDQQQLEHLESLLIQYDVDFNPEENLDLEGRKNSLYYRMHYGPLGYHDPSAHETQYQLHLNVERIRVPEILFQPFIVGLDQAGISEIIQSLLKHCGSKHPNMAQNIFLTGTHSSFSGFKARLTRDVRMMLPVGTSFQIRTAKDPRVDAWRGASSWSRSDEVKSAWISKKAYEEYGSEYMLENPFNTYIKI